MKLRGWVQGALLGACSMTCAFGYEQKVSDEDDTRQFCSGMYGGSIAHINGWYLVLFSVRCGLPCLLRGIVTFDETSRGQLAMAIYEWQDVKYLGKETYGEDDLPVSVDLSRSVSTS